MLIDIKNLIKLNEEGHTVLVITHEREIADCTKRIIEIRDGRITSDASIN